LTPSKGFSLIAPVSISYKMVELERRGRALWTIATVALCSQFAGCSAVESFFSFVGQVIAAPVAIVSSIVAPVISGLSAGVIKPVADGAADAIKPVTAAVTEAVKPIADAAKPLTESVNQVNSALQNLINTINSTTMPFADAQKAVQGLNATIDNLGNVIKDGQVVGKVKVN
jgi:uncharacterized protein YoxC